MKTKKCFMEERQKEVPMAQNEDELDIRNGSSTLASFSEESVDSEENNY